MRITIILIIILVLLTSLLSLNAKAIAVASDYLENNMIVLEEGNSTIYSIRIQNTEAYEAAFKVDYDNRFMKVIDFKEQYVVAPKSSYRIEFNITAPPYNHKDKNSNLFVIGYTAHQLTSPSGGGIPFLTKINKNFKLQVAKKPSKFNGLVAAGLIVMLAVIVYTLIRIAKISKNLPQKYNKQKINKQRKR